METFNLEFSKAYTDDKVVMQVQASNEHSASELGDTIANQMPVDTVFFDKNDCDIEVMWFCSVEPVGEQ